MTTQRVIASHEYPFEQLMTNTERWNTIITKMRRYDGISDALEREYGCKVETIKKNGYEIYDRIVFDSENALLEFLLKT